MMILHSCDNRKCCNPNHLRAGTGKDNYRDALERNRLKPNQLPVEIPANDLLADPVKEIAKRFGCGLTTVYRKRSQIK